MKILIYLNTKKKLLKNNNGGIESLNYYLFKFLKKNKLNVTLLRKYPRNNKLKKKYDIIISSNDARIFDYYLSNHNFLWLHNVLQIEKSIRKNQFFSILRNKISCIFVSEFLKKKTSLLYNFNSKKIIPNFLTFDFDIIHRVYNKRKNNIIWSINRKNQLDKIIFYWINNFFKENKHYNLLIFGSVKKYFIKSDLDFYRKFNIFFYGNVSKKTLKRKYLESKAMICLAKDETFCLNAIEGLSCGLPIICYQNTVFDEIIKNNYNGFKIKNVENLNKCLLKVSKLNNKQLLRMNKNCYKNIEKYNSKIILKKWLNLINNCDF